MKKLKNSTSLISISVILFIVLGCCGKRFVTSYKEKCITPDGSKIAMTDSFGGITIIDSETGEILQKKEYEEKGEEIFFGVAVCTGENEILAVYPNIIENLTSKKRFDHSVKGTVFDKISRNKLITFTGGTLLGDSDEGYINANPLEIYLENLGENTDDIEPIIAEYKQFTGLEKVSFEYWIKPIRLMDGENLLVVAGSVPSSSYSNDGSGNEDFSVRPDPWGFYTVNLKTNKIKLLGSTKKGNEEISFVEKPKITSTIDGRYIGIFTYFDRNGTFTVYDTKKDSELFKKTVDEDESISDILFSKNEKQIIAIVLDYSRNKKYLAKIYDSGTGELIKDLPLGYDSKYILDFRDDEIITHDDNDTVVKTNAETGKEIWKTKYFDK